jgi:hypothetical protein
LNRIGLAVLSGIVLMLAPLAQLARGQSVPPAQQLIVQAQGAFAAAGSAHVTGTFAGVITQTATTLHLNTSVDGDLSWRQPASAHLTGTVSLPAAVAGFPVALSFETVLVDRTLALRLFSGSWSCMNVGSAGKGLTLPGVASAAVTKVLFKNAVNLGADAVDGVAVWHVRQAGRVVSKGARQRAVKTPLTIDLYIAQSGSTLRRVTASWGGTSGTAGATVTASADFSMYGETIQVQLPAGCSSQSGTALGRSLRGILLGWTALLRLIGFSGLSH